MVIINMIEDNDTQKIVGDEVQVADRKELKQPPLYKVVLLNDDYTPMEFVVYILEKFFHTDRKSAVRIMLQVHVQGKGICGVFTHEIAETKVAMVNNYAREYKHPLLCTMEQD